MKTEFKVGDRIKIMRRGCNNTGCPEGSLERCLNEGDTVYTVARVESTGKYQASTDRSWYTLILDTGHPVWSDHCVLAETRVINNYQIY